jgi:hypothetical protein
VPKLTVETTSGNQVSRSASEGNLADAATRTFRIVLNQPGETFDIQQECNVRIGDVHPNFATVFCNSVEGQFDGDSRMVYVATFRYQSTASQSNSQNNNDPKNQPPNIRPADWSVSASLIEVPVYTWQRVEPSATFFGGINPIGAPGVPVNAAGDRFDAIARYEPLITISVQHFEATDPTTNCRQVGSINQTQFQIGSLACPAHTIMLRGISSQPVVESWGDLLFRGWNATYEFAYRKNLTKGLWNGFGNPTVDADLGWDIAVPETGFNVLAFVPAGALPEQDVFGQPLKHDTGRIADPLQLPDNVAVGDRMRAMVKVMEYEDGGASQLPSAQPIALNDDGTPRKSFGPNAADPPVIIKRYQIYDEYEFRNFALRGLGN